MGWEGDREEEEEEEGDYITGKEGRLSEGK